MAAKALRSLELLSAGTRVEQEAVLFTLRDLIVLIVVVAVLVWFISRLRRK